MAVMAKAAVQTTIRLDPELYERAKRMAERSGQPLNTYFVHALQDAVVKSEHEWRRVDAKKEREG